MERQTKALHGSLEPTRQAQLPHYPVEAGRAALGPADVVVGRGGVPEHREWPVVWTVVQQAAEREAHLGGVDAAVAGSGHRAPQDLDGEVDHDPLVPGRGRHVSGSRAT